MTCPKCGSKNITEVYRPEVYEYDYICHICDHKWDKKK